MCLYRTGEISLGSRLEIFSPLSVCQNPKLSEEKFRKSPTLPPTNSPATQVPCSSVSQRMVGVFRVWTGNEPELKTDHGLRAVQVKVLWFFRDPQFMRQYPDERVRRRQAFLYSQAWASYEERGVQSDLFRPDTPWHKWYRRGAASD